MENFVRDAIEEIIRIEGGYVNDPKDSGGETNYGITRMVALQHGYRGSMRDMSRDVAVSIYASMYWEPIKGSEVAWLSKAVAKEVFDTAVNMGTGRAVKFLQESLNVLNKNGRLYDDLTVDAQMGPVTIDALYHYLLEREEGVLVKMLNCLQGAFYVELAKKREKDERFIYGWFKNRISL